MMCAQKRPTCLRNVAGMGWLRLGGSLKLQFSFAKGPYKWDYVLPKRPIIWRSLLIVATPYFKKSLFDYALQESPMHSLTMREKSSCALWAHAREISMHSLTCARNLFEYVLQESPMRLCALWLCARNLKKRLFDQGVATISRLLKIIGLFCKRALQKRRYSAKEIQMILRSLLISATPYALLLQDLAQEKTHRMP